MVNHDDIRERACIGDYVRFDVRYEFDSCNRFRGQCGYLVTYDVSTLTIQREDPGNVNPSLRVGKRKFKLDMIQCFDKLVSEK